MTTEELSAAIKAIDAEVLEALYHPATIVNNLPEDWQNVLNLGSEVQSEFSNPTDYKVDAVGKYIRAGVKQESRSTVAARDNAIAKYAKTHDAKLTREQVIEALLKMQSFRILNDKAAIAEVVLTTLK